jgi:Raf kinase inhibitor-like YbhB/YbcL family protein
MSPKRSRLLVPLLALAAGAGLAAAPDNSTPEGTEGRKMKIQITSTAFKDGEPIPAKHSCSGADVSPPLSIASVPKEAKSLILIVDDPDAPSGNWTHWVLYGISPQTVAIPEGSSAKATPPVAAQIGKNSWGKTEWGGPCPPPGGKHRYYFRLYAVDTNLSLPRGTSKPDLMRAIEGHVLAQGELMGTFQRK